MNGHLEQRIGTTAITDGFVCCTSPAGHGRLLSEPRREAHITSANSARSFAYALSNNTFQASRYSEFYISV